MICASTRSPDLSKSFSDRWERKPKGSGAIWKHPLLAHAIVDTRGFGSNARISYKNERFDTVVQAKLYAEEEYERSANG